MRFLCRIDGYSSTALRFRTEGAKTNFENTTAGPYLATNESQNFGDETAKMRTTPILNFLKFCRYIVFVKQIVYIGLIDLVDSKSGLIFE